MDLNSKWAAPQVLGNMDILDKLHLDAATGQYRDYGLHSEVSDAFGRDDDGWLPLRS